MSANALRLSVALPENTVYVYGTVNGTAVTWTMVDVHTWEAIAPRSVDDIYRLELQYTRTDGKYYTASLTLYYGVVGLIYDRTHGNADRVAYLDSKGWRNLTQEERDEWLSDLMGAYNTSDLNRVGTAVDYVATRLQNLGYAVTVDPRTDWSVADVPTLSQMETYLANVRTLRAALAVSPLTPPVPGDMDELTITEANNIERVLWDVNLLISNMIAAWRYSGEIYSGEV